MLKIITIIGTRPEVIRLSSTIKKLDDTFDHIVVHTGQNYDPNLSEVFYSDLELRRPDYQFYMRGKTLGESLGLMFTQVDAVLEDENPDAVVILGDTNSALASILAKKRSIPIFHIEAGNRSFYQRVPEEINRKIVDHISDINITYSQIAREYLLQEKIPPDQVIKVGSPLSEVLQNLSNKIHQSSALKELNIEENGYLLVSVHRQENLNSKSEINEFLQNLNRLGQHYNRSIILSLHPRTRSMCDIEVMNRLDHVITQKPFNFTDYVKLQKKAFCVLSDSGSITEETSLLNLCSVNLRLRHERPEGDEVSMVPQSDFRLDNMILAIDISKRLSSGYPREIVDYHCPNFSDIIVGIINSKIPFINKFILHKND